MLPDAKKGIESRLLLLTAALEDALRASRWNEVQVLLDERATTITELSQFGSLSPQACSELTVLDGRILNRVQAKTDALLESQMRINQNRKAINSYRS